MTLLQPPHEHDTTRARMLRQLHQGSGWCMRCGMPWAVVKYHDTPYSRTQSCFPLCESCWALLGSPEARIEYYKRLVDSWELDHAVSEDTKFDIMRAVANGK